jgi:dynactin 1
MEGQQHELETLEKEVAKLKKQIAKKAEKPGATKKAEPGDGSASGESDSLENYQLVSQLENLKAALRYLRAENSHLKTKTAFNDLGLVGLAESKPGASVTESEDKTAVKSMALETRVLLKDIRAVGASPKVVTLTKSAAGKWQTVKKTPDYQYQAQQTVLYTLQKRSNELKVKVQQLTKSKLLDAPSKPVHLPAAPQHFIAKIRLPQSSLPAPLPVRHHLRLRNAAEFEKIHAIFVN